MKKSYEAPVIEKIEFCYEDQVVASQGCEEILVNIGDGVCSEGNQFFQKIN